MSYTHNTIEEIEVGSKGKFHGVLMIKTINFPTASNGSTYLNAHLMDKTGVVVGRKWKTGSDDFPFEAGDIIEIKGTLDNYNGQVQIMIETAKQLPPSHDRANPMDYLPAAPISTKDMMTTINHYIQEVKDGSFDSGLETKPYYTLLISLMKEHAGSDFYQYPAAKVMHHDFVGGLAYHTTRMLKSAEQIADIYNLDKTLLYTAVMLHDIGKISELSGIIGTEYTVNGRLLGHISTLDGWLIEAVIKNGYDLLDESVVLLRHTLLAHHGIKEYGSPVTPAVPEAYALHQIDMMDARLTTFQIESDKLEDGALSQRLIGLSDTIYKPNK